MNKAMEGNLYLDNFIKKSDLIRAVYDNGKELFGLNVFGIGFDALLCNEVQKNLKKGGLLKKLKFVSKTLELKIEEAHKSVELRRFKPLDILYQLNFGESDYYQSEPMENVLAVTVLNGKRAASGIYQSEGEINDGMLEMVITKNMNLERSIAFLVEEQISRRGGPVPKEKTSHTGIRSMFMNILNYNPDDLADYFVQMDGEHYPLEKPSSEIRVEAVPSALNIFHDSKQVPRREVGLRQIYFPEILDISDNELRILSEWGKKHPSFS
jgi:diacylglycerol kinase family enzyme